MLVRYLCALWILSFAFPSCNTTKFLKDDEVLLSKISIIVQTNDPKLDVVDIKSELQEFYLQEPNTKTWIGVPREWYYFKNLDSIPRTSVQEYNMKKIAEVPAILDTFKIEQSAINMQNYLRNKKGFYTAEVSKEITVKNKRAEVTYYVTPQTQYVINELDYIAVDKSLAPEIEEIQSQSILSKGDPIDAYTFDLEKQRIVSVLQNKGYARFNFNYIEIEGDSSKLDQAVNVRFNLHPPAEIDEHIKFSIGEIKIYTDYYQLQSIDDLQYQEYKNKKYYKQSQRYLVKPEIIDKKIFLKSGETYKANNYDKTVRKLYGLDTYKFNKISPSISPDNPNVIDYQIFLTPHDKKYITDYGVDAFYSDVNYAARNLVGFGLSIGLENRNTFRGSEKYKLNFESGVELNLNAINTAEDILTTFTLGLNNTLDIPRFTRPLNVIPFYNKLGIIPDKAMDKLDEEGTSKISVGYNYTDVLNFYQISSFNTTYGFDFKLSKNHRVRLNQIGLNYARNIALDSFQVRLDRDPLLERSFQSTFFSGLIFRDISYGYESDEGEKRWRWVFLSNLETSGLEIWTTNKVANALGSQGTWGIGQDIDFSKFVKLDVDWRVYKRINSRSQFAARFHSGIVVPFGESNIVSWLKQFSAGGPNSIRGWRPMQIGPGGYFDTNQSSNIFFQRGGLLIEYSMEYRFDLFWRFEGGLFFDGGNVWTLYEEENIARPDSKISGDFYKQMALGYGYGIRMDFTYFLIRFDFGFKLKNPVTRPDTNRLWEPLSGQNWHGNVNVAVDYAF